MKDKTPFRRIKDSLLVRELGTLRIGIGLANIDMDRLI